MIFECIEVVYGVFCPVERLDLRHSELCRKGDIQHNGDSVCYTKASMETGAGPFTATFMWLISYWMSLNLCSHDLSSLRSSPRGW